MSEKEINSTSADEVLETALSISEIVEKNKLAEIKKKEYQDKVNLLLYLKDKIENKKKLIPFFDWSIEIQLKFLFFPFVAAITTLFAYMASQKIWVTVLVGIISLAVVVVKLVQYNIIVSYDLFDEYVFYIEDVSLHSVVNIIPIFSKYDVVALTQNVDTDEQKRVIFETKNKKDFIPGFMYHCKFFNGKLFTKKRLIDSIN